MSVLQSDSSVAPESAISFSEAGRHTWIGRALHEPGQEMIYVIRGRIVIKLARREMTMKTGDCIYFDASLEHEIRSLGQEQAEALVVISDEKHGRPGEKEVATLSR